MRGFVVLRGFSAALVTLLAIVCAPVASHAQDSESSVVLTRLRVLEERRREDFDGPSELGFARGGVPLPRALGVTQTAELHVAMESVLATGELVREDVPVQMRVLSRWGGARDDAALPIRWVLVDVDAPTDAALVLVRAHRSFRGVVPVALEATDAVVVDDRRLEHRVPRARFAPLSSARLRESEFEPSTVTALQDAGLDIAVVLRDARGDEHRFAFSDDARVTSVVVEDSGPLRATVLTVGDVELGAAPGSPFAPGTLRADLRLHASRGAASVDLELAIENRTSEPLDVVSLTLLAPTRLHGIITCAGCGHAYHGDGVRLEQFHSPLSSDRESDNFAYTLTVDDDVRARGERSDGVLVLSNERFALGVAVDDFWERHPGSIALQGGVLSVGVLPRRDAPHRLAVGGRTLSRVTFALGGGAVPRSERRLVSDPEWVTQCGVLGPLPALGAGVGDDVQNAAVRHLERLQLGLLDVTVCDAQGPVDGVAPASIVTQRETRGGANPALPYSVALYGWERFGDLVDADGTAHGDHGWVAGLCRAYLARQDVRFLGAALDLARHRQTTAGSRDGIRAVEGLLLLHALTGDESLRRTALDLAARIDASEATAPELARAVSALLACHAHDGSRDALGSATSLHERLLAVGEGTDGSRRPLSDELLLLRAHEEYHRATGDARALAAFLRELRPVMAAYSGTGRIVNDAYLPAQPHDSAGTVPLQFPMGIAVADFLAYAHEATGESRYLDRARQVFRDAVLFLQAAPMEVVGAGYHARVSAAPLRHPGREIEYGELILAGARRLVATDVEHVLRGGVVAAVTDSVLLLTAAATRTGDSRALLAGDGDAGDVDVGDSEGGDVEVREARAPDPPSPEPGATIPDDRGVSDAPDGGGDSVASPPPRVVVVDDGDAVVRGRWSIERSTRALHGSQSVAGPQSGPAGAVFRIVVPFDGRVRVYAQWQAVPGRAASANVRLESRAGAVSVEVDTARGAGHWRLLGELDVGDGDFLRVDVERASELGTLAIDGVRVESVR